MGVLTLWYDILKVSHFYFDFTELHSKHRVFFGLQNRLFLENLNNIKIFKSLGIPRNELSEFCIVRWL